MIGNHQQKKRDAERHNRERDNRLSDPLTRENELADIVRQVFKNARAKS